MVVISVITLGTGSDRVQILQCNLATGIGGSIYCLPNVLGIQVIGSCITNGVPIALCVVLLTLSLFISITSLLGTIRYI